MYCIGSETMTALWFSSFTKYNWCILCCWHGPLLSKKWATRPWPYITYRVSHVKLDLFFYILSQLMYSLCWHGPLFNQRNEPQDPGLTLHLLTGCSMSNLIFFSRFYYINIKYNWLILCRWHGSTLSEIIWCILFLIKEYHASCLQMFKIYK